MSEPEAKPFQGTTSVPYSLSRAKKPCVVCGRNVIDPKAYARVARGPSGYRFVMPEERVADGDDMGGYPVGSECMKKIGRFAVGQ